MLYDDLSMGDKFMDAGDEATIWMKIDIVTHPETGVANKVAIFSRLEGVVGLLGWTNENDPVQLFR